ncbi:DsrE family protein [Oryzomicrobium sp.]|uniref:DsrE family protein n=1 Tax=Oryzomicrobium sp. TaxID=1911578 RepID=UPI0025D982B7|nr:DsrE family protein [Oryzomicrobium sp.]MCE1241988.1 DsrE family protein [Oryzomicrobium sp.]
MPQPLTAVLARAVSIRRAAQFLLLAFAAVLALAAPAAQAGPDDPSRFDGSPLGAQKAVYHFNYEKPEDLLQGLGYLQNHLRGLKEFGDLKHSHLVIVAHGNELHMLSRLNRGAYPDIYDKLKELTDQGVTIRICRNAAAARGYKPGDFYDLATVVPAAMTDLAKWQAAGYAYISGDAIRRTTRQDFLAKHPEVID